ncbi:MAG: hypothetical protein E6G12_05035 [Actinobacteria bacterium]|nr:MAG: hypothetical protein E6G12_05035 [Actinomycetota bacterium]
MPFCPIVAEEFKLERDTWVQATHKTEHVREQLLLEASLVVTPHNDPNPISTRAVVGRLPAEGAVS